MDRIGQLRRVSAEKHGQNTLKSLFGDTAYLLLNWPRAKQTEDGTWEATGWRPEECGSALMDACVRKGVFDPDTKVRCAGAWKGDDGELIVHFGSAIGVWPADGGRPASYDPCELGGWIYPTRPVLPHPAKPASAIGAAEEVLAYFRSWNWARPDVDPWLLLGFVVASFLGASVQWHPLFWAVGDRGTGKSTMLMMIYCLLGNFMLKIENATSAYIYQKVGRDSRAVGIDEAEPDEESTKLKQQMELARAAASGSVIGRGGADGTPVEFFQNAPYLFCSINMPGLNGADLSRIAVGVLGPLEGHALPDDAKVPPEEDKVIMRRVMEPLGRRLLRRVVDNWHRFPAVLKAFRGAMKAAGHSGRGADLFGTQLACAHLVLSDAMPTEVELAAWGERMKASELAELSTDLAANKTCLLHLLTSMLDVKQGGQSFTVGHWVEKLATNRQISEGEQSGAKDVREVLRTFGLDVRPHPKDKGNPRAELYLWVAYRHQQVAKLFQGSTWESRRGAGSWVGKLASLDGACANVSFHCGGADKAVLVPIHYCQEGPPDGGQQGERSDPSAAGRSPVQAAAVCDPDPYASDRSAADTASADHRQAPDPFALSEGFHS
ncbi:hypothetical protein [Magnetospirillum moscoviense]|uniref:DUF927 domain-containing protein n=1 Tax=Magnetospirillum moscoviense TaxID=1437059 RepID=A0A178MRW6_9PROT|nr:hypothetical protein [Magnetospirillum moscoviense]OAN50684.1 hypothetical protein A6A05_11810 [Magnetospirillum moscoviense]